jgi:hypothetical protein
MNDKTNIFLIDLSIQFVVVSACFLGIGIIGYNCFNKPKNYIENNNQQIFEEVVVDMKVEPEPPIIPQVVEEFKSLQVSETTYGYKSLFTNVDRDAVFDDAKLWLAQKSLKTMLRISQGDYFNLYSQALPEASDVFRILLALS